MTAASRRGAQLEDLAARVLGTTRVRRAHYGVSASDVEPVRLPSGLVLQPEAKSRKRLPYVVTRALAQAARYLPGCVPLAVVRQRGGRAIACVWLDDLARIVGIAPPDPPRQPPLPFGGRR